MLAFDGVGEERGEGGSGVAELSSGEERREGEGGLDGGWLWWMVVIGCLDLDLFCSGGDGE